MILQASSRVFYRRGMVYAYMYMRKSILSATTDRRPRLEGHLELANLAAALLSAEDVMVSGI